VQEAAAVATVTYRSLVSHIRRTYLVPRQLCIHVDVQARITIHVDVDQLMKPDNINTRHSGVLVWQSQQSVRGRDRERKTYALLREDVEVTDKVANTDASTVCLHSRTVRV